MVSKRQKIITVFIAVLVVFTVFVYLMPPSSETPSRAMILKPSEIGPVWQGQEELTNNPSYAGETSRSQWTYWPQNNTVVPGLPGFDVLLIVFNTTASCQAVFDQQNSTYIADSAYSIVPIGDQAFLIQNRGYYSNFEFMRGTVLCGINIHPLSSQEYYPYDSWWDSNLSNIVKLQLDKIDHHLGL
jgi:hypothetical protein